TPRRGIRFNRPAFKPKHITVMENRRRDYRHPFVPHERLSVHLSKDAVPETWQGEIVDLSVSGMGVRIADPAFLISANDRLRATFALGSGKPMTLLAENIHATLDTGPCFGFHFLPPAEAAASDARERDLWAFLLEQQRQLRRKTKTS